MKNINSVLLLGSGALKIGEAGEFDYSGSQAIKALKEEGKRVVLVNPNIATIQTSKGLADEVYFLPVTAEFVTKVIAKEKPDGIMISFGGQTALNCGMQLAREGILEKNGVQILGTPIQAVIDTEDRQLFAQKLSSIGLKTAHGKIVSSVEAAKAFAKTVGYPIMLRTGFALGGTGSGIIKTEKLLTEIVTAGLKVYPQLILEECLYGWKEIEYEIVRDSDDNCITVCNMENFDPTGIHTGESIVVAPSQTLSNSEYFKLRQIAIDVIRAFKIVGECNIQYALHPKTSDYRIIEVNARLSRSSALASKATGYPLAYVAAKLALGKRLWEIPNSVTKKTTAYFEPALDYIVVKIPRWDIDKFHHAESGIGSEMKSVGEVMSIGRTFAEAIQKGTRMLNDGYEGVIDVAFVGKQNKKELLRSLGQSVDTMRLFTICSTLYQGITTAEIHTKTRIDPWFLEKLSKIVDVFKKLEETSTLTRDLLQKAKQMGFSDGQIAKIKNTSPERIRILRYKYAVLPRVKRIDTTAGEFPAQTNYLYLTYHSQTSDYLPPKSQKKVMVIGSGPYAIGTSVEFDWCAVNAIRTAQKAGYYGIMINCNPETVSTDYDTCDVLFFEELTLERVRDIYDIEKAGCLVSVGGQIPNNLTPKLSAVNIPTFGVQADQINTAEDRVLFSKLLDKLEIKQPRWQHVKNIAQAQKCAHELGYPLLLRPSFVLSGKAMRIIYTRSELEEYFENVTMNLKEYPLLVTQFLHHAQECDFDAVAKKGKIVISALSEHIEGAGVHSGDSSLIYPAQNLSADIKNRVETISSQIISELNLSGPCNIQFLIKNQDISVIECNLRASRSFPFVSKVSGINFIETATKIMLDVPVSSISMPPIDYLGVKVPQFSFRKLKGADPKPHVEMNSTGEVACLGRTVFEAYLLSLLSTGMPYPTKKTAMISVGGPSAKLQSADICQTLSEIGFILYATAGTAMFLREYQIPSRILDKIYQKGNFTALTVISQKQVDFVINVTDEESPATIAAKTRSDGYLIRRTAIDYGVPIFTNLDSARTFVRALKEVNLDKLQVASLNDYRNGIK